MVDALDGLAADLARRDLAAAGARFAPDFAGARLGLLRPALVDEFDGVRTYRFLPGEAAAGAAALGEWLDYLAGFAAIEKLGLHVHRVHAWAGDEPEASVRFELIGTPHGAAHAVVDRALLRVRFARAPEGLRLRAARLLSGERVAGGAPHFTEVGAAAGIDFANQWYPGFLDRPLRFGMIRYGPGGISAADVDNDGFYDLFVPDGVASRLLRNRGDGGFEDWTAAAGLAGLDGASVGLLADYDNDGWKDLFVSRTFRPNQLFHNEGLDVHGRVRFTDVTAGSGLGADCCTTVASWGDYDLDGDLDLYVGRYLDPRKDIPTTFYARNGEPNQLYRNDGPGGSGRPAAGRTTFTNVTAEAGVGEIGLCLGSVWGDYDGDGDPDLYVVNDFGRNTLYRNEGRDASGRVTFTDVTVASGTLAYGAGMSASFGDYDNDGRLDLYVANIRSEHAWFAESPTVGRYMANSFRQGVWSSDMPLYLEIFRQSGFEFVPVFQQMASGNTLLRNRGRGASGQTTFADTTWAAGANPVGWYWGSAFADLDNDGWQDIYSTDGWVYNRPGTEIELEFLNHVVGSQREYKTGRFFDPEYFGTRSWHGWERNRHLRNLGPGPGGRPPAFREIGRAAGTDLLRNSRGLAVADFWNRGALDLAVAANGDRHALLRNELAALPDGSAAGRAAGPPRRGWLAVELVGTRSNRDAVGARVTARSGSLTQTREVALGDGYGSQNALRLHFGLGAAHRVDELVVRWPASGTVQRFRDVAADRIVEITEGADRLVEKRYPPRRLESL